MSAEDRTRYERFYLAELRRKLDPDSWESYAKKPEGWVRVNARETNEFWRRVEIQEIRLDDSGPRSEAVVLMRDRTRPECLFGWRAPAWPGMSDQTDPNVSLKDAAIMDATVVWANLDEDVLAIGFPKHCSPSGVTWF